MLPPGTLGIDQRYRFIASLQHIVVIVRDRLHGTQRFRLDTYSLVWRARGNQCSVPRDTVPESSDHQFVVLVQTTLEDADAIDADAVGAAQVAHHQIVCNLRDTAVAPRNLARVNLNVALRMSADQDDRLIDQDI